MPESPASRASRASPAVPEGLEGLEGLEGRASPAIPVYGATVDDQTRCVHYRTAVDVVVIQFHCCERFYPCYRCHAETETHAASPWPVDEWDHLAILCGVCRATLSIRSYQAVHACPTCAAPFNEACALHAPLYFAVPANPVDADAESAPAQAVYPGAAPG